MLSKQTFDKHFSYMVCSFFSSYFGPNCWNKTKNSSGCGSLKHCWRHDGTDKLVLSVKWPKNIQIYPSHTFDERWDRYFILISFHTQLIVETMTLIQIEMLLIQIEFQTPRNNPRYLPRTLERQRFTFTTSRPWTQQFWFDNAPGKPSKKVFVEPIGKRIGRLVFYYEIGLVERAKWNSS